LSHLVHHTRIVRTMAVHKGKSSGKPVLIITLALPVLCLVAYAIRLPLPIPRFLIPARSYQTEAGTVVDALRDAAAGPFRVIRLQGETLPTAADFEAAGTHYRQTGMPVRFMVTDGARSGSGSSGQPSPVAATSVMLSGDGSPSLLTLLLAENIAGPARVFIDGDAVMSFDDIPPDRRLKLPLPAGSLNPETVVTLEAGLPGSIRKAELIFPSRGSDEPRILMASKTEGARSVIEALQPVKRIAYGQLETAGIFDYEALVLDGPSLAALGSATTAALAGYVERGVGSLVIFVDSPEFGKPGDAPELERLLPVELSPNSLSRLPDVAMAVALDVSGSMFGDKLSLAKAVGLELFGNLKTSDVAGILLFDDEARWLNPLAPVSQLDARQSLAPLRAGGGTKLFPAVELCLAALEASGQPEKRLVLVSDGISAPANFDLLAARAFSSGIVISAMAVGEEYDRALLTRLSTGSGGRFYRVRDASGIPSLIVEDRKSISRTVFLEQMVGVVDIAGVKAGYVDGMARLGLKAESTAFFSSEAGDPLLSMRRTGARSVIVFASDAYGRYDREFLAQKGTLAILEALLDGLFSERSPSGTLSQTADGASLSIQGDYLVAPQALLADSSGMLVAEQDFEPVAAGRFFTAFPAQKPGRYTALVLDRGRTVARFPLSINEGLSGRQTDSVAAEAGYPLQFWALPRGGAPWLIAFFVLSLAATVLLRMRR